MQQNQKSKAFLTKPTSKRAFHSFFHSLRDINVTLCADIGTFLRKSAEHFSK